MKIVLCTGGFDPLHSGHIEYLTAAKALGDKLIVGINSDSWLGRKKGRAFMPAGERIDVVQNLKVVDHCILFNDNDDSAIEAIKNVRMLYPSADIIFANGGDRTNTNIPEMQFEDIRIEFVFGVGGTNKANSSSWILEEWKAPKTIRPWGYYRVLHEVEGTKVKELIVMPGKTLSMQRHADRSEMWFITNGSCVVDFGDGEQARIMHQFQYVPNNHWHRLYNPFKEPCKIVEIQYGMRCDEDDIERR